MTSKWQSAHNAWRALQLGDESLRASVELATGSAPDTRPPEVEVRLPIRFRSDVDIDRVDDDTVVVFPRLYLRQRMTGEELARLAFLALPTLCRLKLGQGFESVLKITTAREARDAAKKIAEAVVDPAWIRAHEAVMEHVYESVADPDWTRKVFALLGCQDDDFIHMERTIQITFAPMTITREHPAWDGFTATMSLDDEEDDEP